MEKGGGGGREGWREGDEEKAAFFRVCLMRILERNASAHHLVFESGQWLRKKSAGGVCESARPDNRRTFPC